MKKTKKQGKKVEDRTKLKMSNFKPKINFIQRLRGQIREVIEIK